MEYKKLGDANNTDFSIELDDYIKSIEDSNGTKYFKKFDLNIGIICDEFLYRTFENVANFIYITPKNYIKYLNSLDLLFVVSTWTGLKGEWEGMSFTISQSDNRDAVFEVIEEYKKNNIKIVFYSKEDPPNYDRFVDIAKECDYIFTTAVEKIDDYKRDCNNEHVFLLEFGINPLYHNPIGIKVKKFDNSIIFAGSWYKKFPERAKIMSSFFDNFIENNIDFKIVDRHFYQVKEIHMYPEKYQKFIYPSIEHKKLQKLHKLYNFNISFSTVTDSQTMMPNRNYELMAIGSLIISNNAISINKKYPNIFTQTIHGNEIKNILNNYSDEELLKMQMLGLRLVMKDETAYHRLAYLLNKIEVNFKINLRKKVLVVCSNKEINDIENFERQTYENKELVSIEELFSINLKQYDYITFFNNSYLYEEFYLEDMINGFKYTNCDYITKDSYKVGKKTVLGIEHNYVNTIKDKYVTIFDLNYFDIEELLKQKGEKQFKNGYSIDYLEVNKKYVQEHQSLHSKKISVIIPIYNNGEYLLGRSFPSILRSSIFNQLEVILVDYGSTDKYTKLVLKRLDRQYENVKVHYVEHIKYKKKSYLKELEYLTTCQYITYLYPENEIISDSLYIRYKKIVNTEYFISYGNSCIVDGIEKIHKIKLLKEEVNESDYQCIMFNKKVRRDDFKEVIHIDIPVLNIY